MPDTAYTYKVHVDTASAQTAARQLRAIFQREMATLNLGTGVGTGGVTQLYRGPGGVLSTVPLSTEQQAVKQAVSAASASQVKAAKAAKAAADAEASIWNRMKQGSSAMWRGAGFAGMYGVTGATGRAAGTVMAGASMIGGGGGAALGLLGGAAVTALLAREAMALGNLGEQAQIAGKQFEVFSGGAANAAANLEAMRRATDGGISNIEGMQISTRLLSMGLVENASDMERVVRIATLLGDKTKDVDARISDFTMLLANNSIRRLDNFGISIDEVRQRKEELLRTNKELGAQEAFVTAVIEAGTKRVNELAAANAKAATSAQQLNAAWTNLKITAGEAIAAPTAGGRNVFTGAFEDITANMLVNRNRPQGEQLRGWMMRADMLRQQVVRWQNQKAQGLEDSPLGKFVLRQFEQDAQSQLDFAEKRIRQLRDQTADSYGDVGATMARAAAEGGQAFANLAEGSETEIQRILTLLDTLGYKVGNLPDGSFTIWMDMAQRGAGFSLPPAAGSTVLEPGFNANVLWSEIMRPITQARVRTIGTQGYIRGSMRAEEERFQSAIAGIRGEADATRRAAGADVQAERDRKSKEAADDFARKVKDAADDFKDKITNIPGLTGTTSVTEEDMAMARAGLYQEKADEKLRRLKDEVMRQQDLYPDVSLADFAARAGLPMMEGQDKQIGLYYAIESMWRDSSLFAGGKNLDLVNMGAAQNWLNRQEAGESGKQALLGLFGVQPDGTLDMTPVAAAAQKGLGAAFTTKTSDGKTTTVDLGKPVVDTLTTQMSTADWLPAGQIAAEKLLESWQTSITAQPWAGTLISAIEADLIAYFEGKK